MPCALHLAKVATTADFLPPLSPPITIDSLSSNSLDIKMMIFCDQLATNASPLLQPFEDTCNKIFDNYQKFLYLQIITKENVSQAASIGFMFVHQKLDREETAAFANLIVQINDHREALSRYARRWILAFRTICRYQGASERVSGTFSLIQDILDLIVCAIENLGLAVLTIVAGVGLHLGVWKAEGDMEEVHSELAQQWATAGTVRNKRLMKIAEESKIIILTQWS